LGARRTRQDEVNEILQGQNFEAGQARLTQAGQNERAGANRSSQEGIAANTLIGQNERAANLITAANTRQEDQQAFTQGSVKPESYHDGKGGIANVKRDPTSGATYTVDAIGTRFPIDISGLTPYSASQADGSRPLAAQVRESQQNLDEGNAQIVADMQASTLGRILAFPDLNKVTGKFDVNRVMAEVFPVGEEKEKAQSMIRQMNNARTLAMGPALSMMGVNPTDRDVIEVLKGTPTTAMGPMAWIDYVRYELAPMGKYIAELRLREGTIKDGRTQADIDMVYAELIKQANDAEERIFGGAESSEIGDFDPAAFGSKGDVSTLNDAQQDALLEYLMQNRAN